jgi:hypothetical protein
MSDNNQNAGKRSAWMTHVKKTMKANKGKSLMQVLKMAKKTYKKTMRGGGVGETAASLSGGRRRKGSKTKKNGFKLY